MTTYKERGTADQTPNAEEMIRQGIRTELLHTWTAMPGVVESFDAATQTASVNVAIQQEYITPDQITQRRNHPVLINVPVQIPRTAGFALTLPVAAGDEGLIVFCSRCIDSWAKSGGVQPPEVARKQSLSDAIFIPGVFGRPAALSSYITDGIQMRNAAGDTTITLKDGSVDITAATITLNGETITNTGTTSITNIAPTITNTATLISLIATTLAMSATTMTGNAGGSGTIDFTSSTMKHNGTNVGDDHDHPQGDDSDGDTQQDTGGPQ